MTRMFPSMPAVPDGGAADETGVPVSQKIRERLRAAKQRFHANDNIAAFIEDGELEALQAELTQKMSAVLDALVIDTESDHNTIGTAARVARMYVQETFRGRYVAQ